MTAPVKPRKATAVPEPPDYKHKHILIAGVGIPGLIILWFAALYLPLFIGVICRKIKHSFNIDNFVRPWQDLLLHFNLVSIIDDSSRLVLFRVPLLGGYQLCYTMGNLFATIACVLFILAVDLTVNIIHTAFTHQEIITD